jgi:hypothetical protein
MYISILTILMPGDAQPSLLDDPTKSEDTSSSLSQAEKQAIVLQSATLYHETSSMLLGVYDIPFPDENVSGEIANSLPEVVKLQLRVAELDERVTNLAKRSVVALQWWYELVEGFNGCIAEWDERLRQMETVIMRKEKVEREADEY